MARAFMFMHDLRRPGVQLIGTVALCLLVFARASSSLAVAKVPNWLIQRYLGEPAKERKKEEEEGGREREREKEEGASVHAVILTAIQEGRQ